jgi:ATP-dependent exoDNAse (exonuclease V) alpha subunit
MNDEQKGALDAVKRGKNIFLTGAGGTGKSYTIKIIVDWARESGIVTAVTAMTGCAALLLSDEGLQARTLHSWASIGLGEESSEELASKIMKRSKAKIAWQETQLLIIDEVSMMSPELLEKLNFIALRVRKNPIQLVLAGDFCQLPPINAAFAFETPVWTTLVQETHTLTQIVRQSDPVFQQILTEARLGALTPESIKILESRRDLDWSSLEIKPTLIYSRNADVNRINRANMDAIEGDVKTFKTQNAFKGSAHKVSITPELQSLLDKLDKDGPYEPVLDLKVGAQVMLIRNLAETDLVNGSRGIVTGYSGSGLPMVQFKTGPPMLIKREEWMLPEGVGRSQIPLRIAYAITVHKSQGMSLDSALIDIGSSVFEYGQAYVALSRVRSLEGLYIHRLQSKAVVCHPKVKAFYL